MVRALGVLKYARHLWDWNPRGEAPSAEQAGALATRPKCPLVFECEGVALGLVVVVWPGGDRLLIESSTH